VPAICNALSSAQLAANYPQVGGTYEYGYRVLHPWLGFAAGWVFLASKLLAGGAVAMGFAGYLANLIPGLPQRPTAAAAVIILTAVNYVGIKKSGRLNTAIVAITVATLAYFVIGGLPIFDSRNFEPFAPAGIGGILQSAALLFFAYTGYARLATLAEEVDSPRTTIPRAIIVSLGLATVLYLLVSIVAVGSVGADELAATAAPLERAAQASALPGAVIVIGIGAVTAMLGVLLSQLLGISRMFYAMARRRDLPSALDHINPRYEVPDRGILLTGAIIFVLTLVGDIPRFVSGAAFTILLYYSITNIAALRMPAEQKLYPDWVAALGLVSCLVLAGSLPLPMIAAGLTLLALGFVLRAVFKRLIA
jgi:basic amino acid/polyamine antiporter, APA family